MAILCNGTVSLCVLHHSVEKENEWMKKCANQLLISEKEKVTAFNSQFVLHFSTRYGKTQAKTPIFS